MNVELEIKKILSDLSGEDRVNNDTTLQGDLALDSLSMVRLLIEIEEVFQIRLDEKDMNPFDLNTVKDIIGLVKKYNGDENEKTH